MEKCPIKMSDKNVREMSGKCQGPEKTIIRGRPESFNSFYRLGKVKTKRVFSCPLKFLFFLALSR